MLLCLEDVCVFIDNDEWFGVFYFSMNIVFYLNECKYFWKYILY